MKAVLLVQAAATLFMSGVIWFVQIVHYPLMSRVSPSAFSSFEAAHSRRTSLVVVVPMLAELATACFLLWRRPPNLTLSAAIAGAALVAIIWMSTFLLQVPQHDRLGRAFDQSAHHRLVTTNWIRTAAWSARAILVLWMLR